MFTTWDQKVLIEGRKTGGKDDTNTYRGITKLDGTNVLTVYFYY